MIARNYYAAVGNGTFIYLLFRRFSWPRSGLQTFELGNEIAGSPCEVKYFVAVSCKRGKSFLKSMLSRGVHFLGIFLLF